MAARRSFNRMALAALGGGVLLLALAGWTPVDPEARIWMAGGMMLGLTGAIGLGVVGSAAVRVVRRRCRRRVLVVGAGPAAARLVDDIETAGAGYQVVGVVDRELPAGSPLASRWSGHLDQVRAIARDLRAGRIVIAADEPTESPSLACLLYARACGVRVMDATDFRERLTGKIALEAVTPDRLVFSPGFRNTGLLPALARVISVAVAAAGIIITAPALLLVAVAIKLESSGPVLFVQERAGRDGRTFRLLKLRTMRESGRGRSEWARDNSHRITRLGRWLRRFRIDELPQLVNVLKGDMNIIGPRPHPAINTSLFDERISFYALRAAVLPGITGWAQVRYGYANTLEEEAEKMRYDLYYIKYRSLWLDLRIMVETVAIVLRGHGWSRVRTDTPGAEPLRLDPDRSPTRECPGRWMIGAPTSARPPQASHP